MRYSFGLGKTLRIVATAVALSASSFLPADANLLVNPGFDNSTGFVNDGNGAMTLTPSSTTITGWTVATNNIAWITTPNPFGLTAQPGSGFFLDLQGYSDGSPYGAVQQTVSTCTGCGYELTFYLGSANGNSSINAAAASQNHTFTSTNSGTQNNLWQQETFDFTATGTSTLISLNGITAAAGIYIGLDTLDLEQTAHYTGSPRTLDVGDAASRVRGHRLHGVSSEGKACIECSLIHDDQV